MNFGSSWENISHVHEYLIFQKHYLADVTDRVTKILEQKKKEATILVIVLV